MIDRSWVMSLVTKLSLVIRWSSGCLALIAGAIVLICLGDSLASLEIVSYSLTNSMLPRLAREGTYCIELILVEINDTCPRRPQELVRNLDAWSEGTLTLVDVLVKVQVFRRSDLLEKKLLLVGVDIDEHLILVIDGGASDLFSPGLCGSCRRRHHAESYKSRCKIAGIGRQRSKLTQSFDLVWLKLHNGLLIEPWLLARFWETVLRLWNLLLVFRICLIAIKIGAEITNALDSTHSGRVRNDKKAWAVSRRKQVTRLFPTKCQQSCLKRGYWLLCADKKPDEELGSWSRLYDERIPWVSLVFKPNQQSCF